MVDIKGKRLLLLGGTRISCEIIRAAQEMEVEVIVADYNTIDNSPGKQMVQESYEISVLDVEKIIELIQTKRIDGVLTGFSDTLLVPYAEICMKANLPCYGTVEQFKMFTDKKEYKALCNRFDIPTMEECLIDVIDDTIDFPVIVKPRKGSGSRGITICNTKEELLSVIGKEDGFEKQVIIEKYINAPETTVFWVFVDGQYYLSAVADRHIKEIQKGVIPLPIGYTFPSDAQEKYLVDVVPKVKKMLEYMDVRNGMMFMQCKMIDGVCHVYDIGYRLTGSLEYLVFEKMHSFNPLKMMIRYALTGNMGDAVTGKKSPLLKNKYGWNISILMKPGIVDTYNGIDSVEKRNDVIRVVPELLPGDEILESDVGKLKQICLRILGVSNSYEEMRQSIEEINVLLDVKNKENESIRYCL